MKNLFFLGAFSVLCGCGQIKGPFHKNDPVHEILTAHTFHEYDAGYSMDYREYKSSKYEYLRGVIWSDDPESLLFDKHTNSNRDWSAGVTFVGEYCAALNQSLITKKPAFNAKELTKRSHFGDLQFFHAMASSDEEIAIITRDKIYNWLRFLYLIISSEDINNNTKINSISHPFVNEFFSGLKEKRLKEIFGEKGYSRFSIKKRATGSFLHVIQDSYFPGHVSRKNGVGDVKVFLNYANQDIDLHEEKDTWNSSFFSYFVSYNDLIHRLPQYNRVIEVSVALLKLLDPDNISSLETQEKIKKWEDIEKYLNEKVFNGVSDKSPVSFSGKNFGLKETEKKKAPWYCNKYLSNFI